MSGIPTPARPSKLVAPGSIARPTAISKLVPVAGQNPVKKGLKRLNGEDKASDAATKRAKTAMGTMAPPSAKNAASSSQAASSAYARKPLGTRNTIASRTNSGSSLNKTVASARPTTEKPKAAGMYSLKYSNVHT